jgi:hypothetical protein
VIARSPVVTCKFLTKPAFQALVVADASYSTLISELVAETEATRKKRDELMKKGAMAGNTMVTRFVTAKPTKARVTDKVQRGTNSEKQKMINNYAILRPLGAGSFGKVYLCRDTTDGKVYAIKQVDKAKLRRKRLGLSDAELMKEVEVMKRLRHPNLVELHEVIDDKQGGQLYMVQVCYDSQQCNSILVRYVYRRSIVRDGVG